MTPPLCMFRFNYQFSVEICSFNAQWWQSNHLFFMNIKIKTHGFSNFGYLRWNNSLNMCIYQMINKKCGMPNQELLVELLEYLNHYKSLHFRCHWSKITWERTKDLCIEFFPQYFCKDLHQPSHGNGNLQDQCTSIKQCNNAQLTHEESSIHQDLGNLMKTVENLDTQMRGNQVPP